MFITLYISCVVQYAWETSPCSSLSEKSATTSDDEHTPSDDEHTSEDMEYSSRIFLVSFDHIVSFPVGDCEVLRFLYRISLLSDLTPVMKLICLTLQPVPELLSAFFYFFLLFPPYPRSFRHSSSRFACSTPSTTCSRDLFDVSWGALSYWALWRTLGLFVRVLFAFSILCHVYSFVFIDTQT